jgi:hypothetical protein
MRRINKWPPAIQRVTWLASSIVCGTLLGIIFAAGWGDNFRTKSTRVDGLGTFYRVALPKDIRERNDVRTAEIAAPGASDYERIGVNNYWIASSENPNGIMSPLPKNEVEYPDLEEIVVNRNHDGRLRGALIAYLQGRNFVVFEMENSSWGYCAGGFDVRLNGNSIVGVPLSAPSDLSEILSLLRTTEDKISGGFHNVLCSRRIVEIDLGVRPEPLKRLLEFVGIDVR